MIQAIKFYCSMKICIVSPGYPERKAREWCIFVAQLVEEIAKMGNECYVVAPYSITRNRAFCKFKTEARFGEGRVTIFRPNYISCSNLKLFGVNLSNMFHKLATKRALKKMPTDIDCVYCHFWNSAIEAYDYARSRNLPLFVATGESVIPEHVMNKKYKEVHDYVSGVICVSSKNRTECVEKGLTTDDKCVVIPNSINPTIFHKKNKAECRRALAIPEDAFVVVSVGGFSERKGINRVAVAIELLPDDNIYSLFIGSGNSEPICRNIIFKGAVQHDQIVTYLNAADVFVLPTLGEGCCNAIVEAMACGLPIISSDRPFNYDILNADNSIMVEPENIEAIAAAIHSLYIDSCKRQRLSEGSLLISNNLKLENRARRICEFIYEHLRR